MLSNFFRINLPYGIAVNDKGEWMAFNREYMPLGYNSTTYKKNPGKSYLEMPIYTKYKGLTEKFIIGLIDEPEQASRDENGEIRYVFLYNDGSNPTNGSSRSKDLWERYFQKLEKLAKLSV